MFLNKMNFIKRLISESGSGKDGSIAVTDQRVLQKFIDDADFPFLVSFPRTGSHWLRMIMELYFERPSLVRIFYYKDRSDFMTLHTHDMDFDVFRKNVIYLYRNPVPTVYSQMMYDKENMNDPERVGHWARYYGKHLRKWLVEEDVSTRKTIVRYENMTKNLDDEFAKIAAHFSVSLDPLKLHAAAERVSKSEVKKKTVHDQQVVNLNREYASSREEFARKYGSLIEDAVFSANPEVIRFFEER